MNGLASWPSPLRTAAKFARRKRPRVQARLGISLLEVMISMFIMLVGILSVFSLVTLGRFEMLEGSKADRGMSVARGAQREMLIRGYLRPLQQDTTNTTAPYGYLPMWLLANGNNAWTPTGAAPWPVTGQTLPSSGTWYPSTAGTPVMPIMPFDNMSGGAVSGAFALDPIGVAASGTTGLFFPPIYQNTPITNTGSAVVPANSTYLPMTRITMRAAPFCNSAVVFSGMPAQEADSVFRSQDDLVLNPLVGDQAPTQAFSMFTPATTSIPARRLTSEDYSWLATIAPTAEDTRSCIVSVVVFYKRNPNLPTLMSNTVAPPERMVNLNVGTLSAASPPTYSALGAMAMAGGGDVLLTCAGGITADYTKVRANQWILVSQVNTGSTPPTAWWHWYRVASTSDAIKDAGGNWQRPVKLEGPDWIWNPSAVTTYAAIFDDVVGVYERTIELEESGSIWSPN